LAAKLRMDPVDVRMKNFIPKFENGHTVPTGLSYDSGDYAGALKKLVEHVGYKDLRRQQAEDRKKGRYLGVGVSTYVEICGLGPSQVAGAVGFQGGLWESAIVRFHPTGKVNVFIGAHPHGQGEETTFAQIVADEVGVDYKDGKFFVKGSPDKAKTIQDIALMANVAWNMPAGVEAGLEASSFYDPPNFTYPFGAHLAVVELDPETGQIDVRRYVAVDDCGPQINPVIVEGQVHGGVVQGIGQALWEGAVYDENGQLLTGSMLDYALPRADRLPDMEVLSTVTPSPHHPIGVKGIGEAGTIASTAAVYNAVIDALSPFGVQTIRMPVTPERAFNAIQEAKAGRR